MTGSTDWTARGAAIGIEAFALSFEASPTPMIVTDPRQDDNPIVWVNAAFLTLTVTTSRRIGRALPSKR